MSTQAQDPRAATSPRKRDGQSASQGAPLIQVELSLEELKLLITLASDQLFRREFIDPKMPGHRPRPGEVGQAKALIARLHALADPGAAKKPGGAGMAG